MMRIGDVARRSGVGVETVRFYEKKGLIDQPLRPRTGGYREYPTQSVERIRFVRSAQHLGFSLNEIAELLGLETGRGARCVDVRERAEIKRQEVQTKIANLRKIKRALDGLIDACPGQGPASKCSILEAITNGELHLSPITYGVNNGRQKPQD